MEAHSEETGTSLTFGPVPSRRLGRSLGINNIPPKRCAYSCVYCQVGRTTSYRIDRHPCYRPEAIQRAVADHVARAQASDQPVEALTFVSDGEPTLDRELGTTIDLLHPLGIPVAVISNASLISEEDVRRDLHKADWVSLKVDSTIDPVWYALNRPHGRLQLGAILEGALRFASEYSGVLVTETMLVHGVNDGEESLQGVADFLSALRPAPAYLSVPIRPPAEEGVCAPSALAVERARRILASRGVPVECLTHDEGNAFASTGDVEQDLLSIAAVHPLREMAVEHLLARSGQDWEVVERLVGSGRLVVRVHEGQRFYRRAFPAEEAPRACDARVSTRTA